MRNKNSVEMRDECSYYTQEILLKLKEKWELGNRAKIVLYSTEHNSRNTKQFILEG